MRQVTAAVIIEEGLLLLARRGPGEQLAGFWELPGGKVEPGETPQSCLERELAEELEMEVSAREVVARTSYRYEHGEFEMLALTAVRHSAYTPRVHDAVRWVSYDEIRTLPLAPADIELVAELRRRGAWLEKARMDTPARLDANRELWQRWTELHVPSDFYDVEGFVRDPAARPFDSIVAGLLGGDLSGARALHLQCHFGLDTIRLARLGADATGLDFSSAAVEAARDLSRLTGVPATFIEGNVLEPPAGLAAAAFDLVFTSWGVIAWLPDLEPWARTIASRLAPGGRFKIAEMHPTLWIFDDEGDDPELRVKYSYFQSEPLEWEERGSYAQPLEEVVGVSHSWQHTLEEIIGSLTRAGLLIEELREFPLIAWKFTPHMVEREPGLFGLPEGWPEVPLTFTLVARKPL